MYGERFTRVTAWSPPRTQKFRQVQLRFIQVGKPNQNACIDRFNRIYLDESFDCYVFETLDEVLRMTTAWLVRYNEHGHHESLDNLLPRQ